MRVTRRRIVGIEAWPPRLGLLGLLCALVALMWRPHSAAAAPYEKVELAPSGQPRGTLPLHQGTFITGKVTPQTSHVAIVFFRRVGGPFGIETLDANDCKAIEPKDGTTSIPPPGYLKNASTVFENVPVRSKVFVSTTWARSEGESGESKDVFEVFVRDDTFFRPGASYCMLVLEQAEKRTLPAAVRAAITAVERALDRAASAAGASAEEQGSASKEVQSAIATLESVTNESIAIDIANALINIPVSRPEAPPDPAFDRYARFDASEPFAKVVLGLLAMRKDGAVHWTKDSGGAYVTQDGKSLLSVQVIDSGANVRLEVAPSASNKKKETSTFESVDLGLKDLVIDPPPGEAGQPQTKATSLLDLLDALEGRLPGSPSAINAPPLSCAAWGQACMKTMSLESAQSRRASLDAVRAVLDRGRRTQAKSIYKTVYEWAMVAFPNATTHDGAAPKSEPKPGTITRVTRAYEHLIDARVQWDAMEQRLEEVKETKIEVTSGKPTLVSIPSDLTQQTFVSSHVIPSTGLALLFPRARADEPPSLAYYGGVQIYPWPNPVTDPQWSRCRRHQACPDALRLFALELALTTTATTTATTRVPANRGLHGVNGSAAIPLLGLALQPLPYLTGTLGMALTGERALGVEGERWKTVPVFYLGISVQANVPGIIRSQMPNSGGTSP